MVVVQLEAGKIRGKTGVDSQGKKFFSFQNIPYAAPPTGDLRFKAPQPVQPWLGIKDATKEGNESMSRHLLTKKIVGSEDCLNLNVYTPELPGDDRGEKLKPVMFWIHGGAFMTGSNKSELHGPEFLMAENIVLVAINYRLGVLGFLSLDDPSLGVPGNAGFKDMVMALKWVQTNIGCFSGDPNNVTVFGHSAGAASAHLLMLSPMTKGLFHRVIMQSASALNSWVFGQRSARTVAQELGYQNTDDRKILPFLQSVPAIDILKAQYKIDSRDFVEYEMRFFGAVVERASNEEAFLTERPIDIMLSGNYNHVPVIMGYNYREGIAFEDIVPSRSRTPFFQNVELSVPIFLNIERGSELSKVIAEKIKRFYYGDVELDDKEKFLPQFSNLSTDTSFFRDLFISLLYHLKTATQPIYFYQMILETELNVYKKISGATLDGVYHGDELGYLFKTIFTPEIQPGSIEDVAQQRLARLWTNFARFGNPTPGSNDGLLNVSWKNVEPGRINYLEIGKELQMKVNPDPDKISFWKDIFKLNPVMFSKL